MSASSTNTISDGLLNPSSSTNNTISLGTTMSSNDDSGLFSGLQNVGAFTWIIIIFLLAFFGFNIFVYLAKGTEEITSIFKPFIDGILALIAHISAIFVGVTAAGTKNIVSGTADVIDSGLSKIESGASNVAEKTSPSSLKSQPVESGNNTGTETSKTSKTSENKNTIMDNNSLNKSLNTAKASQSQNSDYEADNSGSTIQSGSNKSGWCYIGEDRGFRSCMEIGQNDKCMSGDIFPSKEICVNPNLRA